MDLWDQLGTGYLGEDRLQRALFDVLAPVEPTLKKRSPCYELRHEETPSPGKVWELARELAVTARVALVKERTTPKAEIADLDLRMPEVRLLFGQDPRIAPVIDQLAEKSQDLIQAGSRVGTLYIEVTKDGNLEIRFVSRYRIVP